MRGAFSGAMERPCTCSTVNSQAAEKRASMKKGIVACALSVEEESSCEKSRVSAGIAFVDRASMVGPAAGSYHAIFASMAQENARRHKRNAMVVCRCGRNAAGKPGM